MLIENIIVECNQQAHSYFCLGVYVPLVLPFGGTCSFLRVHIQCCPEAKPLCQLPIFSRDGPLEMHWCGTIGALPN